VIYLSPLPTSLYQPYPPLKILSSNKYDLRKSDWKEEIIMSCHHHPLFFCFVISSHYQNHQYSTHLLTPNHPFLPQTSYSSYTSFFYINAHTNSKNTHPYPPILSLNSLHTRTGTSTTSPTQSAPNSPEATAASNARKTNVARKSPPPKHSLS